MTLVRVLQKLLVPNRPWIEETRHPEDNFYQYMRELDRAVREPVTRRFEPVTVANLPTDATAGDTAFVSDANATTFASVVAGGGSNSVPVYFGGGSWRIG